MPIAGYETLNHVRAHVAALKRELMNPKSEAHAEAIRGQLGLFEPEMERLQAEAKKRAKAAAEALEASW